MIRMLLPLVSIFFIYMIIKWVKNVMRETKEALSKASEELGFRYEEETKWWKPKEISGVIDGYKCKTRVYTQSHGESSTTYISFDVYFPNSLDMGLKINWRGKFEGDDDHLTDLFLERNMDLVEQEKKRLRRLKITDTSVSSRRILTKKYYRNPENIVRAMHDLVSFTKKLK